MKTTFVALTLGAALALSLATSGCGSSSCSADNCAGCHGSNAVAGPLPDLRYASAATLKGIEDIVLGGQRAVLGMPSFKKILNPGQVRAIMSIEIEGRSSPAVMAALRGVPEVEAVHATNGRWDLVAELCAADLPAFSGALDAIRQIDGIVSTETSLLLQTTRF